MKFDSSEFEETSVGADGTGYFRKDGKYYYGNKQNGYVIETRETQEERLREEALRQPKDTQDTSWSTAPVSYVGGGSTDSLTFLAGLVGAAATIAFLAYMAIILPIFFVCMAVFWSWPIYIRQLVENYSRGTIDLPVIMVTAAVAFLLIYFLLSSYQILVKKKMKAKRFLIVCVIVETILHAFFDLVSGFDLFSLICTFFNAVMLASLPTIFLCFFEHLVTKEQRNDQRWFITRAVHCYMPVFVGRSTGMIVVGSVTGVLGLLLIKTIPSISLIMDGVLWTFLSVGIALVVMGLIGKRGTH